VVDEIMKPPSPPPTASFDEGSFRDRTARVITREHRIYRALASPALEDWRALVATRFFPAAMRAGRIVGTEPASEPVEGVLVCGETPAEVLEHERIPFVSYPYEWSFGMLQDAALLTLDLQLEALEEGFVLKDATPYNVQWVGSRPVFIDIPSFQRLSPGTPWTGYRQFCELFLFPLFLQAYKGVSYHAWLRGSINGITADQCRSLMSPRDYVRPGVLTHVYLQSRLQARYGDTTQDVRATLRSAGFGVELIKANVRRLRTLIASLTWSPGKTAWSDYAECNRYEAGAAKAKQEFVESALSGMNHGLVWDLGSNTGTYSRLLAGCADHVVAFDADLAVAEGFYVALRQEGPENILPLFSDLADPSPGLGWRGAERRPIESRGQPDLTLALALLHHLVITSNIPLPNVVEWLATLGGDLVVEFVTRDDPMVQQLLRNREDYYFDYHQSAFEAELTRRFRHVRQQPICEGARVLYHAVEPNRA